MNRTILVLIACLLFSIATRAQVVTGNVTHMISKSANKGELYDYYVNKEENQIELVYQLKENKKTLVLETYLFDLDDLHFISSKEEEIDKEKTRRAKVKWGKPELTRLLKIFPNPMNGKLVLKRGYISYGYAGRAVISSFVSEDAGTLVQTQAGDKFIYLTHKTESRDLDGNVRVIDGKNSAMASAAGTFSVGYMSIGEGNVSIVGMEKSKPYYSKYAYTIYDAKTRREKLYKTVDLGFSYNPISVRYLSNGDVGIVFWPIQKDLLPKTKGAAEKFNVDPDKNFKYVQINTNGEKVTDISFKLEMGPKGGKYSIDIVSTDKEGEIILLGLSRPYDFGMGTMMNPKYLATTFKEADGIGVHKAENVVVIKIVDNKVVFKKDTPLENNINNIQTTEGTKALKPESILAGYHTYNAVTDENGSILINGIGLQHEVIQIDKEGNITAYTDQPDHDWAHMNEIVINSTGGVYWINIDIPEYDSKSIDDSNKAFVQRTGVISKLDTKGGKIVKTVSLTPKGIALDVVAPVKMINENELLILGQGKKKEISLSKIVLE